MIVEYKPYHKLSVLHLRAGPLRADNESMNLPKDVINRITIPTKPEERFVYNTERLVAAALTQAYGYMIESGLEYNYLVTGEASIFPWIKEDEPHILHYHLAEPNIEAEAQADIDILLCRTTASQALTFCLLALNSKSRSQSWRQQTLESSHKIEIDHEAILRLMPAEEKTSSPPLSVFCARVCPIKRSPITLRPRKLRKGKNGCYPTSI